MVSLKAKNPFGQDIELLSGKTWLGLGAFAVMLAAIGGMVAFFKSQSKVVTSPIDELHKRLGDL